MIAVACFWLLVRERPIEVKQKKSFLVACHAAREFRRFLIGVGIFGAGDFSHTLLILYATKMLADEYGMARAASFAVMLYTLHNIFTPGPLM